MVVYTMEGISDWRRERETSKEHLGRKNKIL
jgi:hypothetical protein